MEEVNDGEREVVAVILSITVLLSHVVVGVTVVGVPSLLEADLEVFIVADGAVVDSVTVSVLLLVDVLSIVSEYVDDWKFDVECDDEGLQLTVAEVVTIIEEDQVRDGD